MRFRVARRARPFDFGDSAEAVHASHDGYAGSPAVKFTTGSGRSMTAAAFEDRVRGDDLAAVARFHLAPGLTIARPDEATGRTL